MLVICVNISWMKKKRKNSKETASATIASVNREMQKPRLTESGRNGERAQAASVAEKRTSELV